MASHKAGIAVGECRVSEGHELGIIIGTYCQGGWSDGAATVDPACGGAVARECVVSGINTSQAHTALVDGLSRRCRCQVTSHTAHHIGAGKDRRTGHGNGIAANHTCQGAVAGGPHWHAGGAIVGLAHASSPSQGQGGWRDRATRGLRSHGVVVAAVAIVDGVARSQLQGRTVGALNVLADKGLAQVRHRIATDKACGRCRNRARGDG